VDTDVLYPNYHAENKMLHFNANQKWYWLPDQAESEVLVFKAVDSNGSYPSRQLMSLSLMPSADFLSMSPWGIPTTRARG
jgi:hypothetical protein